jgi:hypothetical protein
MQEKMAAPLSIEPLVADTLRSQSAMLVNDTDFVSKNFTISGKKTTMTCMIS